MWTPPQVKHNSTSAPLVRWPPGRQASSCPPHRPCWHPELCSWKALPVHPPAFGVLPVPCKTYPHSPACLTSHLLWCYPFFMSHLGQSPGFRVSSARSLPSPLLPKGRNRPVLPVALSSRGLSFPKAPCSLTCRMFLPRLEVPVYLNSTSGTDIQW